MSNNAADIELCDTCVHLIVNAECIECPHHDPEPEHCTHDEALSSRWPLNEWHMCIESGEDNAPWFSMNDCDGCGSPLGGDRHGAVAIPRAA